MTLLPFFSFYGAKWRLASRYPLPTQSTLVEPFAGSAGYALRHPGRDVLLADIDPTIANLWSWLIEASQEEILSLPLDLTHIDDLSVCAEAKSLIGFWMNKGRSAPALTPSAWMRSNDYPNQFWGEAIRARVARQLPLIRHWRVLHCSYDEIPSYRATWFVDPPYSTPAGRHYVFDDIDYTALANWCLQRDGQVIVCEQEGATWMPFQSMGAVKSLKTRSAVEVMYYRHLAA